jgi:hypothetical protein
MGKCTTAGCRKRAIYGPDVDPPKAFHCSDHRERNEINCVTKRCTHPGCKKIPNYGKPGSKTAEFCVGHKRADDENVKCEHCVFPGCKKIPNYGKPGSKTAEFCVDHKRADDENVKSKRCAHPGCRKQPSCGKPGSKLKEFCAEHKHADDEDIVNKRCSFPGCKTQPIYGRLGSMITEFCADHKRADDVNVKDKHCAHPGCRKIPNFGKPGSKVKEFCSDHKRVDDEDVKSKRCAHPGCKKVPIYGKHGSKFREFCVDHKRVDDEDIANKRCAFPGCKKQPSYGKSGSKLEKFCVDHKRADDEDMKSKHCAFPGCKKQPHYGRPESGVGEFCVTHKRADDENVIDKHCAHPGCKKIALAGSLYARKTHCLSHKQPGEFARRFPKCAFPDCKDRPSWTTRGDNYPTHCETHARRIIDDAQNPAPAAPIAALAANAQEVAPIIIPREIASLQCAICANIRPCDRATGLCAPCAGLSEPRAWHKKREERMAQVLSAQKLIPTSADMRLDDSAACKVMSRPDFLFKRAGYTLIIEVDERQHARAFTRAISADSTASYSCDCELARMIGIHQTLGEPTIFIRYNPDAYVDARGRSQPACSDTARDIQLVHHVMRMLREFDKTPPTDGLYAAYFFYDGMRASHGKTLQPDRFVIDYIDQSVNPWI